MGSSVCFVSHTLCGAFVTVVPGVMSVGPTIFCGFVAPYVVREVPAAESAGDVGAPCWLVSSPVFCWYYRGLCGPCFCLWCYTGAAVGVVVAADAMVVTRSSPVVVAFGSSPLLVVEIGSSGC